MSAPRSIATPVAASTRTRHLVAGPHRQGRVLGVFPSAVYLEFATKGVLELLAVETADGLRLPCAATLGAASSARPLTAVRAGDDARAGECHIDVGPLVFDVVRWWTPRRPRSVTPAAYDDARLALVSRLLPALPPDIGERLAALTTALGAARADDVAGAATALLGLGDGLTPLGDDVLAGLLVTFAATPPAEATHATEPLARLLADAVADEAPTLTTTLSAALLRDAADGFAVPALVDLIDALHGFARSGGSVTDEALADVVGRLLAVGHTSGAGLAHGALAATRLSRERPAAG